MSHSGKTEKLPVDKALLKKEKDKDKKNKQEKQKEEPEAATSSVPLQISQQNQQLSSSIPHQEEEEALECLELPPPMKPIQDAIVNEDGCIQTANSSVSKALDENDLAEIEQIVKEKMVRNILIFKM